MKNNFYNNHNNHNNNNNSFLLSLLLLFLFICSKLTIFVQFIDVFLSLFWKIPICKRSISLKNGAEWKKKKQLVYLLWKSHQLVHFQCIYALSYFLSKYWQKRNACFASWYISIHLQNLQRTKWRWFIYCIVIMMIKINYCGSYCKNSFLITSLNALHDFFSFS